MVAKKSVTKALWLVLPGLFIAALNGCSTNHPGAPHAAMNIRRDKGRCPGRPLAVPGTDMTIGANWGRMPPMTEAIHRPWPAMKSDYFSGVVKHNPIYLRDLDAKSHYRDCNPTFCQEAIGLANIPWFYTNLAITPVLMCLNPPWTQVCSVPRHISPIYQGYLPLHGAVAPVPMTGRIDWPYPVVHISGVALPKQ